MEHGSPHQSTISYPKSVLFIIGNEFCERFTFYGLITIMSLYLKTHLHLNENTSTVVFHIFIMFCYFFPLVGGVIADSWLGKFKTILYLSIVYAAGNGIVTLSAFPNMPAAAIALCGLCLIAIGAGCVKPCVSAFGGDQFVLPQQETHLKKFFSIFYFTINAGSFISSIATPLLRQVDCFGEATCYSLAFCAPTTTMIIAIVFFVGGTKFYIIKRHEGNIILKVFKCIGHALRKRERGRQHWLDRASDKYDLVFINDIKAALRVLVLFLPLPFFWALFDQQGSRWTFQAFRMNGDIGAMKIEPDQMQVINPILILVFIPLFEAFVYPAFARYNLLKKPLQKLAAGGFVAAFAFVVSAGVELKLEDSYAVMPQANEGQMRLYNALPQSITVNFIDSDLESQTIDSMDYWKKCDIPSKDERKIKISYAVDGTEKTETLTVFENALTSYIIMPDKVIQIRDDDPDKSVEGDTKFMIIYSQPTKNLIVTISGCGTTNDFNVSKEVPYSEYKDLAECTSYVVTLNEYVLLHDVEAKRGGVYVLFILDTGGAPKANVAVVIIPNNVHMLWLVPQYVLITAAEVMFSITGLEFSFTQAPVSMKALLQASWLMTIAIGNLLVAVIAHLKVFERQFYEFLLFAGLMALDMCIFSIMAMRYTYVVIKEPLEDELGKRKSSA